MLSKKALLVAFHFPPVKVSSGLERTLALARHLPNHGWEPLVLTASPLAYPAVSDERVGQIPEHTIVKRSFALDASRHLAFRGRYPRVFSLPDRWQTWVLSAIPTGLAMIRRHRPQVIWSTYPITSAHWIGYALHRITGIPWVADFRDPMVEENVKTGELVPYWPALRQARLAVERRAASHASAMSFCTEGARQICVERYPGIDVEKWHVIPNGFDESAFAAAEKLTASPLASEDAVVLLHSGTIYPTPDRDPSHFFRALRRVLDQRLPGARPVKVVLRASGVELLYIELLSSLRLTEHVRFSPALAYEAALREMMDADGLIIFQGYTSNPAIPAKLYEYFRARRPILALADQDGETAKLILKEAAGQVAPLDDDGLIAEALTRVLGDIENAQPKLMEPRRVVIHERAQGVAKFAALFDEVSSVPLSASSGSRSNS
jgi:glycosyltransferase involved in cell wall biosynthesis